jgi:hypothetical protein
MDEIDRRKVLSALAVTIAAASLPALPIEAVATGYCDPSWLLSS